MLMLFALSKIESLFGIRDDHDVGVGFVCRLSFALPRKKRMVMRRGAHEL